MVSAQIEEASTTLRESKAGEDMGLAANLPAHFTATSWPRRPRIAEKAGTDF